MRSRLVMLLACVIAAVAVAVAASLVVSSRTQLPAAHASLPTSSASYLGVYETGPPHAYQPVADFTKVVGKQPNFVGYYSGWGSPRGSPSRHCSRRQSAGTAPSRSCRWILPTLLSRGSPRVTSTATLHADSVRDFSATRSSSASGTR